MWFFSILLRSSSYLSLYYCIILSIFPEQNCHTWESVKAKYCHFGSKSFYTCCTLRQYFVWNGCFSDTLFQATKSELHSFLFKWSDHVSATLVGMAPWSNMTSARLMHCSSCPPTANQNRFDMYRVLLLQLVGSKNVEWQRNDLWFICLKENRIQCVYDTVY